MSENHQINLNINAAGAKRGAKEYTAAVRQIAAATKSYKAAVEAMGGSKSNANFSKMAKDLNSLSNVRVSPALAKNVRDLGAAMNGFKGPSASSVRSSREFLRALSAAQINPSVGKNLAAVSTAMSNFKGLTRNKTASVTALLRSLSKAQIPPSTARNLAAVTSALSGFRGPTAASVRNVDMLVNSLNRLRRPPNLSGVAAAFNAIAAAGGNAGRVMNTLGAGQGRLQSAFRNTGGSALRLTGNMRGLENAMSLSYQAGSQLRVLFGSLTLAEFTRGVYNATLALQKFQTTIGVTSPNMADANAQMEFAIGVADKYGISLSGVMEEYGKFATAAGLAGQKTEEIQYIFESVSSAMRVMGTDTMGQARVFRALSQIFSKGAVRAEELVQQLGEQIPGAFQLMQDALSDQLGREVDLAKMLELGQVDDSAVVLFAQKLTEKFGPQVAKAMERADTWVGKLSNSWTKFQQAVGQGGVQEAIGDVAKRLSILMDSEEFQGKAKALAEALATGIRGLGDAVIWTINHMKELGAILAAVMAAKTVGMIASMAAGFVAVGGAIGVAGVAVAGVAVAIGAAVGALAYYWDSVVQIGDVTTSFGTLAKQAFIDVRDTAVAAWDLITGFTFEDVIMASFDFARTVGEVYDNIVNLSWSSSKEIAKSFTDAFSLAASSAEAFGVKLFKSARQIGNTAVNAGSALIDVAKGGDSEAAYKKFITDSYNEFNEIEKQAASKYEGIMKRWGTNASDYKIGFGDALIEGMKKYADRANDLEQQREANAREAERKRKERDNATKLDTSMMASTPDMSQINPIKGSDKGPGGKDAVSKRLKDAAKASADYKAEVAALNAALQSGDITLAQYNAGLEFQARKLQESADPYAAMVRGMKDEIGLQNMATRAREIEVQHRQKINELAEQGVHVTAAQSKELRKLIETQRQMSDRPLKDWVDGIEKVGTATDKVAVQAMEGLSDQIADLVVDGKADFASLAKSILKEFIKIGVNQLYKGMFGNLFGGAQTAAQQTVSTPARDIYDARQTEMANTAQGWDLRGGRNTFGNTAEEQKTADGLAALDNSAMKLRGTLDVYGNSQQSVADAQTQFRDAATTSGQAVKQLESTTVGTTPQVESLGTAAQNAAAALDQMATSSTSPSGAQPFPGDVVRSGGATSSLAQQASSGMPAVPFNPNGNVLTLSPQEITDLKKTLATEAAAYLKGDAYNSQAAGITDTILNRKVSGRWGDSVTSVVNARKQFSDINGPVSWKEGRRSVSDLPDSMLLSGRGKKASDFVDDYLAKRMGGQASSVGGHLNYANPLFSSKKNLGWINALDGPKLGAGQSVHYHGTVAGQKPVDPNYSIQAAGIQAQGVQVDPTTTSSIQQVNQNLQQLGQTAQTAAQQTQAATQQEQVAAQTETMTKQQKAIADQQAGMAVAQAGQQAQQAAPGFQQAGQSIAQAGQTAQAAQPGLQQMGGGIMSLLGPLSSVVPGLGQFGGAIMQLLSSMGGMGGMGGGGGMGILGALFGSFKEGGISTDPVAFRRMPHYAEGTANTGPYGSQGIPSVLHPNEAVIPLTRGRKVPVEMASSEPSGNSQQSEFQSSRAGGPTVFNLNLSGLKSADDFKRSQRQISQKLSSAQERTRRRNN
ncbi:MAG: tape measure protein [Hoeflea sp.]|uniref:tape measure protein n=1 Tax=Hoeflea sp. TaxID=1940281 RepID=UPI0032F074A2